jgi:intracellular sulfur oxidation DsrE/DsrF family protein
MSSPTNRTRRSLLSLAGLTGMGFLVKNAQAHHTETHFEDTTKHKLVYQCNKAEYDYIAHILFSVGEMLREYGDDIELVVTTFGPGVHLLGKKPGRPISPVHQDKVSSLADYGVSFHACGNTMKSLGWTEKDLLDVAKVVPIGAVDLMELQEKGFSYISW